MAPTSISQRGPPLCILDENNYNLMLNPNIDMNNLVLEEHFTEADRELLESIKNDVHTHRDFIIESGYTGIIDGFHTHDIIGTDMVSTIGKRILFL